MTRQTTRRDFLSQLGISAAAANLALNLPSLGLGRFDSGCAEEKTRLHL